MNKEVILKYKDVFDWWLNGGKVWSKNEYFDWDIREPDWEQEAIYVQDDEYAEFRKALADGKVIESVVIHTSSCNSSTGGMENPWVEDTSGKFTFTPDYYRIKPDEPKFKVGDWVIEQGKIKQIPDCNKAMLDVYGRLCELWKPQDGDVIICLDQPTPRIFEVNDANMNFVNEQFRHKKILPYIGQPLGEMK